MHCSTFVIKTKSAQFQPKCSNLISSRQLNWSWRVGEFAHFISYKQPAHKRVFYFNKGGGAEKRAKNPASAKTQHEKQNNNSPRCFLASANIKNVKRLNSSTLGGGILRSAVLLKSAAPLFKIVAINYTSSDPAATTQGTWRRVQIRATPQKCNRQLYCVRVLFLGGRRRQSGSAPEINLLTSFFAHTLILFSAPRAAPLNPQSSTCTGNNGYP